MSGGHDPHDPHDASDLDALRQQIEKGIRRGRGHLVRYRERLGFPGISLRQGQPPIRINAGAVLDTLLSLAPHDRRESDQEYFHRRSREERQAAERAASGVASHIHTMLSRAYARLAASQEKADGRLQ